MIGSLEKKAAAKGTPHNLILANIKVDLLNGEDNKILPLPFIAW